MLELFQKAIQAVQDANKVGSGAISGFLGLPATENTDKVAYQKGNDAAISTDAVSAAALPAVGLPPVPVAGLLRGGVKAVTQSPELLSNLGLIFGAKAKQFGVTPTDAVTAEQLLKNKVTPNEIFKEGQGLFKGPDGNWRKMKSDLPLRSPFIELIDGYKERGALTGDYSLGAIYNNSELFKAYPKLNGITVNFDPTMKKGLHGSYSHKDNLIKLNPNSSSSEIYETLIHEVQHAIQKEEGWQSGGNVLSLVPDNIIRAEENLENAKKSILNRIDTAMPKYPDFSRDDVIQASRYMGFVRAKLQPTPEMKAGFDKFEKMPDELKEIVKDYGRYGELVSKTNPELEKGRLAYNLLQGEAEAREVENQLKNQLKGGSLTRPEEKYDNIPYGNLLKKGDKSGDNEIFWSSTDSTGLNPKTRGLTQIPGFEVKRAMGINGSAVRIKKLEGTAEPLSNPLIKQNSLTGNPLLGND